MMAPQIILDLVRRFDEHRADYQSHYNETQLRREFLDPFFEALGWDVNNRQGYAEAYKDVIHEDAIRVGSSTKAPDYCFRVGGTRKFFLEAKRPAVNIAENSEAAFQLRRYAWSAGLPLSILSDFAELAVYDCRVKPAREDRASTARTLYLTCEEYPARWDEIAALFSREAVLRGAFDRFAEETRGRRGTATVDAAFLEEIERWRELLAKRLALRNRELSTRDLNFAVQRTIDRIIFLRICEDRGIESQDQLRGLLEGADVYARLCQLFYRADERYNSGLFHFQQERGRTEAPDEWTLRLSIDDATLRDIIRSLYYPNPYEFSVLPADILGQVYERFLGKVIRLTPSRQAKVEEKPEVRKAGGVYYTPTYVVNYIVANAIGTLVLDKSPKQVSRLRVLDPACGSGSFLIGAYQYLLDWHRDWYVADGPAKHRRKLYEGAGGEWRLATAEKRRILLNNVYGVDIDPQAVEVTKLSLLLKVLEGENEQTLASQLRMFHERALPDLGSNIKSGNSLIASDFYDGRQLTMLDEDEQYRVNVFDWESEFPDILRAGGFDAVVGNPPYGMVSDQTLREYFESRYETTEGRFDNYELFIERGIKLCRTKGLLGLIVPSPLLSNLYARKLRRFLLGKSIREISNFGMDVFSDPTIHTCIIVVANEAPNGGSEVMVRKQITAVEQLRGSYDYALPQPRLGSSEGATFDIFFDPSVAGLAEKLAATSVPLGDICFIRQCIKTGNDEVYVRRFDSTPDEPWKATLRGRSITRYSTRETNLFLKYGSWLARNWKNISFYETPKIGVRETGNRITATLDLENRYLLSSLYAIYPKDDAEPHSLLYLLGLINSALATHFVKAVALDLTRGAFTKIRTNQLARLPVRTINFSDPADAALHDRVVAHVGQMLALNKQLAAARTPGDRTRLERLINAADRQIDRLVYELYGLTDAEVEIVERAAAS